MRDEERVAEVRRYFRADDALPEWAPEQWIAAILVKLGQASEGLHSGISEEGISPLARRLACENLIAVAAAAMDAVEAIESNQPKE